MGQAMKCKELLKAIAAEVVIRIRGDTSQVAYVKYCEYMHETCLDFTYSVCSEAQKSRSTRDKQKGIL